MVEPDNLRFTKIPLNIGSGAIPALGFGTLIPDPVATKTATKAALEAGFRQLDASERYRNEKEVGDAMQEVFKAGKIKRADVFVATKLWNNNHRPERVNPPSRRVSRSSNSTMPISISSTLPLRFGRATSKTRGTPVAM
jgi:diketogulonate reductase-like aldo/keto reductase